MKFIIPGTPKPWKRVKRGQYGQVYDPTVKDKNYIGMLALQGHLTKGSGQLTGDLMASMRFFIFGKRRKDIDNLIKLIFDACNKVIFDDDSQVVKVIATKEPCNRDEERTEVEICPV